MECDGLTGRVHSLVHRPYTFALFFAYVIIAAHRLGWRRVLLMTPAGYLIAWASECCSINTGYPYGPYRYLDEGLRGDLRVCGVPFFDSLSYTFLAYFGWSYATVLLAPFEREGRAGFQHAEPLAARRGPWVWLLGAVLMTWLDVAVDPAAARGERWFLGRIFEYGNPGGWFEVPWSNFGGWLVTGAAIIFAYQRIDGWLGPPRPPARPWPHAGLHAVVLYYAVVLFAISVAAWICEPTLALASAAVHLPVLAWLLVRLRRRPRADETS